jgi:hypothetical protein
MDEPPASRRLCVLPDPVEPGRCIVFGRERGDGFEL